MRERVESMTCDEYHLLPHVPGWKYEYWDGQAHIRPSQFCVCVKRSVEACPLTTELILREVEPHDSQELIALFYLSFQDSCEYCDWPDANIRSSAGGYIDQFFNGKRGSAHPASRVCITPEGTIIGAALLTYIPDGANLDMLFVHPEWQRFGIATTLATAAMNVLAAEGAQSLESAYDLANTASASWHRKFGFVPELDLRLAQIYLRCTLHEFWRREQLGNLNCAERTALESECERLKVEVAELQARADREGYEAVTPLLHRYKPGKR